MLLSTHPYRFRMYKLTQRCNQRGIVFTCLSLLWYCRTVPRIWVHVNGIWTCVLQAPHGDVPNYTPNNEWCSSLHIVGALSLTWESWRSHYSFEPNVMIKNVSTPLIWHLFSFWYCCKRWLTQHDSNDPCQKAAMKWRRPVHFRSVGADGNDSADQELHVSLFGKLHV